MEDDIIYISVNNWISDRDYPNTKFFNDHLDYYALWDFSDKYCKENKLCMLKCPYDMSQNLTISAPRSWVMENCPELLENEEYKKRFTYTPNPDEGEDYPEEDRKGCSFLEYTEKNFGIQFGDDPSQDDYEDDDEN